MGLCQSVEQAPRAVSPIQAAPPDNGEGGVRRRRRRIKVFIDQTTQTELHARIKRRVTSSPQEAQHVTPPNSSDEQTPIQPLPNQAEASSRLTPSSPLLVALPPHNEVKHVEVKRRKRRPTEGVNDSPTRLNRQNTLRPQDVQQVTSHNTSKNPLAASPQPFPVNGLVTHPNCNSADRCVL